MKTSLLTIRDLSIALVDSPQRVIIDHVSLAVPQGAVVGIVGGSGSGKTTLGLSVLGLVPPAMRVSSGEIIFEGQNVLRLSAREHGAVRGRRIGMIFQEPMSAFDPVFTIGSQIAETIFAHERLTRDELGRRVLGLLDRVGVQGAERVARSYPHELSGGLRQRAMIAQAIACGPSLLIADEPTSSLDVTLQAHMMELFRQLKKDMGLSIILISHDLGMVSRLADEVAIMCEGKIVEQGAAQDIMIKPNHTYAQKLVEAGGL
ncbi:MAG: ABC transporter ATP-binding protein [Candidatus Omnitrophica bacterium]|nr:ABC transporter ATP-binding protein [Candidatus Omnitrophota bacterium]